MKNVKFNITENGLVVTLNTTIPNLEPSGLQMSDYDARQLRRAYVCDIIGAFSQRLIASLTRRIEACQNNLLNHLEDCKAHNGQLITWSRKDGTQGRFSIASFETMEKAICTLKKCAWWEFANKREMVEQAIKALLNDTEQNHSDCGGFRYSELGSTLLSLLSEGGEK